MKARGKIGWISAAAVVVANMVGTGAFTTLGFQLNYLSNTWSVLLVWVVGGAMALFCALTYAEIGSHFGNRQPPGPQSASMNFLSLAPTCSAASFSPALSMACMDATGSIAATSVLPLPTS